MKNSMIKWVVVVAIGCVACATTTVQASVGPIGTDYTNDFLVATGADSAWNVYINYDMGPRLAADTPDSSIDWSWVRLPGDTQPYVVSVSIDDIDHWGRSELWYSTTTQPTLQLLDSTPIRVLGDPPATYVLSGTFGIAPGDTLVNLHLLNDDLAANPAGWYGARWDNLVVDFTGVPEPSVALLLGVGGLVAWWRRSGRSSARD